MSPSARRCRASRGSRRSTPLRLGPQKSTLVYPANDQATVTHRPPTFLRHPSPRPARPLAPGPPPRSPAPAMSVGPHPLLGEPSPAPARAVRAGATAALACALLATAALLYGPAAAARLAWFASPSATATRVEHYACASLNVSVGAPRWSTKLPNYREVTVVQVSHRHGGARRAALAFSFRVFKATGRSFIVAPRVALQVKQTRACMYQVAHQVLGVNRVHMPNKLKLLLSQPVNQEPALVEETVDEALRLPTARSLLNGPLGKLYVDIPAGEKAVSLETNNSPPEDGTKPYMAKSAHELWKTVARIGALAPVRTLRVGSIRP
jgi:hypothetical protein